MAALLPDIAKVETAIIEITNTVRAEAKLKPVTANPQLAAAARAYADLLARTGAFSHEADGKLGDRTKRVGYAHCLIAENLASHQDSRGFESRALAKSAMEGWLNSPGHRDNIMTPEMTETGVAVAKSAGATPKYIAVQLFGRPQSHMLTFQMSNATAAPVTYTFAGKPGELSPHMALTMQSCTGGPLTFEAKGTRAFQAKFEAADGQNYVVNGTAKDGPIKVDVKPRQTVK
jgi:Cysteine-rich secretory protein family